MGCNAIRTSHNPPAPELLALADRMGILIMDEAFDMWQVPKRRHGYSLLFDDWHDRDLRALVRRDRNHPSVILWSIGNEIPEQGNPQGPAMAAVLSGAVRAEDYSRPVTDVCSDTRGGYHGHQKLVGVFSYNYRPEEYGRFHAANPTIPVFGSETASTLSSRGEHFFPLTGPGSSPMWDFQITSYDLRGTRLPDVVAYKDGKPWATDLVKSAGPAAEARGPSRPRPTRRRWEGFGLRQCDDHGRRRQPRAARRELGALHLHRSGGHPRHRQW